MEKKLHLELIRVIAIILVIYNHTKMNGYDLYRYIDPSPTYYVSYALAIFCKIAVPLFLMISGSLLIPKEESIKDLLAKRVIRFVLVIVIFTFLQYVRLCIAGKVRLGFSVFLAYLYAGNIIEPYWYLKTYLGFLLFLPFIRAMAKRMEKEDYKYLLILGIAKIIISAICIITGYELNVSIIICTDIIFYPLLGHYFENILTEDQLPGREICIINIISVLLATTVLGIFYKNIWGTFNEDFLSIAVFQLASFVFLYCKHIHFSKEKSYRLLTAMGASTFGIYLIEDVVRNVVQYRLHWPFPQQGLVISAVAFSIISFLLSFFIIYIIRKIPYVRKLI